MSCGPTTLRSCSNCSSLNEVGHRSATDAGSPTRSPPRSSPNNERARGADRASENGRRALPLDPVASAETPLSTTRTFVSTVRSALHIRLCAHPTGATVTASEATDRCRNACRRAWSRRPGRPPEAWRAVDCCLSLSSARCLTLGGCAHTHSGSVASGDGSVESGLWELEPHPIVCPPHDSRTAWRQLVVADKDDVANSRVERSVRSAWP